MGWCGVAYRKQPARTLRSSSSPAVCSAACPGICRQPTCPALAQLCSPPVAVGPAVVGAGLLHRHQHIVGRIVVVGRHVVALHAGKQQVPGAGVPVKAGRVADACQEDGMGKPRQWSAMKLAGGGWRLRWRPAVNRRAGYAPAGIPNALPSGPASKHQTCLAAPKAEAWRTGGKHLEVGAVLVEAVDGAVGRDAGAHAAMARGMEGQGRQARRA